MVTWFLMEMHAASDAQDMRWHDRIMRQRWRRFDRFRVGGGTTAMRPGGM